MLLDFRNVLCSSSSNEGVIDPDSDSDAKFGIDIEAGIRIELFEADFVKEFVELDIPYAEGLFQFID